MSAIDGNFGYQKTLSCGRIEVSSEETDYPLTDLFDIAERRNPKRAFLFVSKVLGRHIPVSPLVMRNVIDIIWNTQSVVIAESNGGLDSITSGNR